MKVYLAGDVYAEKVFPSFNYLFNRLDSFYYMNEFRESKIKLYTSYLLDSGAFTFIMSKQKTKIDIDSYTDRYIDSYTDRYIDFIIKNNIDLFFEMDVDSIYGYDKVKSLRSRIESKTGKQSIPVFHKIRGMADWLAICKDYSYVSIGIAGKDTGWGDHKTFNSFVLSAESFGTRVHGLGITGMRSLERVPFYSVDSSSWTCGNRYKQVFMFDGKKVNALKVNLKNKRISNHLALAKHNFSEWLKFSSCMSNKKLAV